jgi:hypothetical protein
MGLLQRFTAVVDGVPMATAGTPPVTGFASKSTVTTLVTLGGTGESIKHLALGQRGIGM